MVECKKIRVGKKYIEALRMRMSAYNLIILRGSKGYVMCGYLNLKTAEKCKDAATKITGVSTIQDALRATVFSCTSRARKLGIYKGQAVRECLALIA